MRIMLHFTILVYTTLTLYSAICVLVTSAWMVPGHPRHHVGSATEHPAIISTLFAANFDNCTDSTFSLLCCYKILCLNFVVKDDQKKRFNFDHFFM